MNKELTTDEAIDRLRGVSASKDTKKVWARSAHATVKGARVDEIKALETALKAAKSSYNLTKSEAINKFLLAHDAQTRYRRDQIKANIFTPQPKMLSAWRRGGLWDEEIGSHSEIKQAIQPIETKKCGTQGCNENAIPNHAACAYHQSMRVSGDILRAGWPTRIERQAGESYGQYLKRALKA